MEGKNLTVTLKEDAVIIGGIPPPSEDVTWRAEVLDERRILLRADDVSQIKSTEGRAAASCSVGVFKDFFLGLTASGFSGLLSVDTGYGVKRIYLSNGAVVFAGSNIIDDRLGEVMFREARITLDELTNSATQVTKSRKFGQVLVLSNTLTNVALWQALKLQVRQVLRSLFMTERLFFEAALSDAEAPTEVVFEETPAELVRDAYSYGCAFRSFLGRLRAESEAILLISPAVAAAAYAPGTFIGDLINLISQESSVQSLLNSSKLIDPYTVAALFNLVSQGLCKITPEVEDWRKVPPALAPLKTKFDAHAYVLQAVRRSFSEAGKEFPLSDVRSFAALLNTEGFPSFYLDAQAGLGRDCTSGIISQCQNNLDRMRHFVVRIESMIQFLLQVAGDNLDFKAAHSIRQDYRSVSL